MQVYVILPLSINKDGEIMIVNESAENYLETILILSKSKPVVRSVDVADELGFKKSSVSVAMKNLRGKGHITVTKEGYIYLTDSGREIAEMIYERHELLSFWLTKLGVDEKVAAEDACRMEHVISKESFDALKRHISQHS
jgi:Mn-dependent DtxR family transcriptional regulator